MPPEDSFAARLHDAVMDPDADLEPLAHEVASTEHGLDDLLELVRDLSAISPTSRWVTRAEQLLEQTMLVAVELDAAADAEAVTSVDAIGNTMIDRDRGDDER